MEADEEGVAVGLMVAVGLTVREGWTEGSVPWQAARTRQVRTRDPRKEEIDRGEVSVGGFKGLGQERLAMGPSP